MVGSAHFRAILRRRRGDPADARWQRARTVFAHSAGELVVQEHQVEPETEAQRGTGDDDGHGHEAVACFQKAADIELTVGGVGEKRCVCIVRGVER